MAKSEVKVKENPLVAEVEADAALVAVWERRMANPLQTVRADVTIKDGDRWELHWIDTSRQGRFHVASREQGWVPVRPKELSDSIENLGLTDQKDDMVRRGPRGEEILMKMPKSVFVKIQKRKAQIVRNQLKNTRENLAQSAAARFGDQAADFMMGRGDTDKDGTSGLKGTIVDKLGETELT